MSDESKPAMRVQCSWCGVVMREGLEPASHSICQGCKEKALAGVGGSAMVPAGSTDRMEGAALMHEVDQLEGGANAGPSMGRVLYQFGEDGCLEVLPLVDVREAARLGLRVEHDRQLEEWRRVRRERWEVVGAMGLTALLGVMGWLLMGW